MPTDKIKAIPLVDKILSLRRIPDTQQQQQQTETLEGTDPQIPQVTTKEGSPPPKEDSPPPKEESPPPKEKSPPPKEHRIVVSVSESSEPRVNRQRPSYVQYMSTVKTLLAVVVVCALFGTIPLYRRGQQILQESSLKVIMLWNEDLDKMPRGSAHMECGCVVTTRRRHYERPADAVVYNADRPYSLQHLSDINRTLDYLLVFAARNPLRLAKDPLHSAGEWPSFNLTMTYRLDSQLVWSEYYFSHLNQAKRLNSFRAPTEHFSDDMPGYKIQQLEKQIKKKDRLVLYLPYDVDDDDSLPQSLYLVELRKYVDLDAHMSCVGVDQCNHYHFMLIFDPTACPDYVPAQMYVAMYKFVVPVLIGGGNLTNLVPPQSYISSSDFAKPKDLAAHLEHLVNAPEEYKRYFWWHSLYKLRRTSQPYCELCSHLQLPPEEHSIDTTSSMGFAAWWTKYQCPNRSISFL